MINYMEYLNKIAYPMIAKSYRYYTFYYKALSMDLEDLKQQIALTIWVILQNDKKSDNRKSDENMAKYLTKTVKFRLMATIRSGRRYTKRHIFLLLDYNELDVLILEKWLDKGGLREESKPSENFNLLEDVKSLLTKQEYDVIYNKFYYDSTFEEIGEELNFSKPRAFQIYNQAIKKLKKHLNTP